MKHIATAPLAYRSRRRRRRSLAAYGFPYPPTTRTITRQGSTRTDAYTYNDRSELIGDVVDGTGLHRWDYDLAAAASSSGVASKRQLSPNRLNQYTAIEDETHDVFTPTYDDDGNQTRVKTSTGIWNVTYNAKNRPVLFTKDDNSVSVECTYDYMGRRATKKVTENGIVTLHQRYLYRGYLQIDSPPPHRRLTPAGQHRSAGCPPGLTAVGRVACCDLLRPAHPCIWLITWDPTQEIATRPLAIQKDGTWYTYGWDLTKNIWEAYNTSGYIGTAYSYTAYGQVTASGAVEQPIQWSSEYNDTELGLVYYNYRHYNPVDGRWIGRDMAKEYGGINVYGYGENEPISEWDALGESRHSRREATEQNNRRGRQHTQAIYCNDDFGRTCDKKTMKNVIVYTLKPLTKSHIVGHSFIYCPSVGYRGKYPTRNSIISAGQIKDDVSIYKQYRDSNRLRKLATYRACPETIEVIAKHIKNTDEIYVLAQAQCEDWVFNIIEKSMTESYRKMSNKEPRKGSLFQFPGSDRPKIRDIDRTDRESFRLINISFRF